jgi:hypothetical protein
MRACPNCGIRVSPGARFCNNCATPIDVGAGYGSRGQVNRKTLIIAAVAVAVLLIGGIVTVLLLTGSKPTKDRAVSTLRDFYSAYAANDYARAASMVYIRNKAEQERAEQDMRNRMVDLSPGGIDLLAEKGTWGKLDEVFAADDARNVRSRVTGLAISPDICYVLHSRMASVNAVAAFVWDGGRFKILYIDDINKLENAR